MIEQTGIGNEPQLAALSKSHLIYTVLRDHILRGVFENGLILREGAVSGSFGVGRAPVASALRRLESEGLIRKRVGHGFLVADDADDCEPLEIDLDEAGLELPGAFRAALTKRKMKSHIYPKVERAVASVLIFGRFRLNPSALADHYGVSRTVAHEILNGLESIGLVRHGSNGRWYAGPLTYETIEEFYELRWLLEPVALKQAAASITRQELQSIRKHLTGVVRRGRFEPEEMGRVEYDLHQNLVLRCTSEQLRNVLIRCQLPIISTFDTIDRGQGLRAQGSGLREAAEDHAAVIDHLLQGDSDAAADALGRHLHRAFDLCAPHFKVRQELPAAKLPPYMALDP